MNDFSIENFDSRCIIDHISDFYYGIHVDQYVYARVGKLCYYGHCLMIFHHSEGGQYAYISVRRIIENNWTGLKAVDCQKFLLFSLSCVWPTVCISRKPPKVVGLPFCFHQESFNKLVNIFEDFLEDDNKHLVFLIVTELAKDTYPYIKNIHCPACSSNAHLTYTRTKLLKMGAQVLTDRHGKCRLSLKSSCDVCCSTIPPYHYEYICDNCHDICLICADCCNKEVDLVSTLLDQYSKLPTCINNLIAIYSSNAYYYRE